MKLILNMNAFVTAGIVAVLSTTNLSAKADMSRNETKGGVQMSENTTQYEMRAVAESSAWAISSSSNYLALTTFMSDAAKRTAFDFFGRIKIEGKQLFMPDFCKLKYMVIGGIDKMGYVAGFYNPFYDTWLVLNVSTEGKSVVTGFKVVPGSYFTGKPPVEYPTASGVVPADAYTRGVFLQTKSALTSMRDKMSGKGFRSEFDRIPPISDAQVAHLAELTKFRVGQALKVADDPRVMRDAVIVRSILCKGDTRSEKFISQDASTKLTLKTFREQLSSVRAEFKIIAYFPSGDETNLIYSYRLMPTLLVHAHVDKDGRVWLKMFDATTIGAELK